MGILFALDLPAQKSISVTRSRPAAARLHAHPTLIDIGSNPRPWQCGAHVNWRGDLGGGPTRRQNFPSYDAVQGAREQTRMMWYLDRLLPCAIIFTLFLPAQRIVRLTFGRRRGRLRQMRPNASRGSAAIERDRLRSASPKTVSSNNQPVAVVSRRHRLIEFGGPA
jgi:hypothetical protein